MFSFAKKWVDKLEGHQPAPTSDSYFQSNLSINNLGYGLRVLHVNPNSTAHSLGLEPWFDYIVGINGHDLPMKASLSSHHAYTINDDGSFNYGGDAQAKEASMVDFDLVAQELSTIAASPNKTVSLTVWSAKGGVMRYVDLQIQQPAKTSSEQPTKTDSEQPDTSTPGAALPLFRDCFSEIGLTVQSQHLNTATYVWRILNTHANSPAFKAQLVPYSDYIVGCDSAFDTDEGGKGLLVRGGESLLSRTISGYHAYHYETLQDDNIPITLYVYNHDYDVLRPVTVYLSRSWCPDKNKGLLGCDVGYGLLHRLPEVPGKYAPPPPAETPAPVNNNLNNLSNNLNNVSNNLNNSRTDSPLGMQPYTPEAFLSEKAPSLSSQSTKIESGQSNTSIAAPPVSTPPVSAPPVSAPPIKTTPAPPTKPPVATLPTELPAADAVSKTESSQENSVPQEIPEPVSAPTDPFSANPFHSEEPDNGEDFFASLAKSNAPPAAEIPADTKAVPSADTKPNTHGASSHEEDLNALAEDVENIAFIESENSTSQPENVTEQATKGDANGLILDDELLEQDEEVNPAEEDLNEEIPESFLAKEEPQNTIDGAAKPEPVPEPAVEPVEPAAEIAESTTEPIAESTTVPAEPKADSTAEPKAEAEPAESLTETAPAPALFMDEDFLAGHVDDSLLEDSPYDVPAASDPVVAPEPTVDEPAPEPKPAEDMQEILLDEDKPIAPPPFAKPPAAPTAPLPTGANERPPIFSPKKPGLSSELISPAKSSRRKRTHVPANVGSLADFMNEELSRSKKNDVQYGNPVTSDPSGVAPPPKSIRH